MPDENRKLTDEELAMHREYVKSLKDRGFCTLDDASALQTRLLNHKDGRIYPVSFIGNDFRSWLRGTGRKCSNRSPAYVLSSLVPVVGQKFDPSQGLYVRDGRTGCTFANTFKRYEPTTECREVSPLLPEFFKRLFPDEEACHSVLQWVAHMFQHPEERPSWHVLLSSEQGTGKGFLVNTILQPLLAGRAFTAFAYSQVMGRFATVWEDNMLVHLDDCKSGSDATQTKLKSLLSEPRVYVERKGLQGQMTDTYARVILSSNELRPLILDQGERRWYAPTRLVHRHDRKETQGHIQKLADWLKLPGSYDATYRWFMAYDLTGFNSKSVPDSAGLTAIVEMSKSPLLEFIEGFVQERPVFNRSELLDGIADARLTRPGDRELPHLIREIGYDKRKLRPSPGAAPVWLYFPAAMPEDEVKALYHTEF